MALDWENIIVDDDENSQVQDTPVTIMASATSGQRIAWDKLIIVEEETTVEGEDESVMIFASGIPGHSATIDEVTAETLPEGSEATVENVGSSANARLRFGIPRGNTGEKGDTGDKGDKGDKGDPGIAGAEYDAENERVIFYPTDDDVYTKDEMDEMLLSKAPVILNSASGSIASFTDGSTLPVTALSVSIDPVQDLHGYDNPWPAGGGKNLLKPPSSGATINGVTFTVNSDGTITANGTAGSGSNADFYIVGTGSSGYDYANIPSGNYIINGNDDIGSITGILYVVQEGGTIIAQVDYVNKNTNVTLSDTTKYRIFIRINAGKTVSNAVFKPMIRLASVTDATFAPYENICPITGWDEAVVTRTGKNLLDVSDKLESRYINDDNIGKVISYTNSTATDVYRKVAWVKKGQTYKLSYTNEAYLSANSRKGVVCDENNIILENFTSWLSSATTLSITPSYDGWIYIGVDKNTTNLQLELSSTASAYEAPQIQTVTIDLGEERYGGTLNVLTGEMRVDRKYISFTGGWNIAGNGVLYIDNSATDGVVSKNHFICNMYPFGTIAGGTATVLEFPKTICLQSLNGIRFMIYDAIYTTAQQFNDFLANNPLQVVYLIATPLTVQLSPSQLSTLLGTNNIWADTGDTSVEYRADTKLYIDGKFSQLQALILEN